MKYSKGENTQKEINEDYKIDSSDSDSNLDSLIDSIPNDVYGNH